MKRMLKKTYFISFLAIFCLLIMTSFGYSEDRRPPENFSFFLEDAVIFAYSNNRDIRMQEQEVNAAKAVLLECAQ